MPSLNRSLFAQLENEEREIRRRVVAIRRHGRSGVSNLPEDGSMNAFEAMVAASVEQSEEVLRRRLAEKSRALAEALDRVREGTYGLCQACGCRIPRRRLEAIPTATLCVPCQEQREAAQAA